MAAMRKSELRYWQLSYLLIPIISIMLMITGCPKTPEMHEFDSEFGRFSILMPGSPKASKQSFKTPIGTLTMYFYMVEKFSGVYLIGYADYPKFVIEKSNIDAMLEGGKKGMLNEINGQLIRQEKIAYGDDPGLDFHFKADDGKIRGRAIIVLSGTRLYQAYIMKDKKKFSKREAKKFLDSFQIW